MGRKARTTTTTRGGERAVILVVVLVLSGDLAGVSAQPSRARFSVAGYSVVRAGHGTSLSCILVDVIIGIELPSSYVWVKDDKVIPGQNRLSISLSNVTRQDAGYYQCGTPDSNIYGQGLQLQVYVPGDVIATPDIQQVNIPVEGRPYSLHCFFHKGYVSNRDTVYTWYKDSVELKNESAALLKFPILTETDIGEYTCTAREGPPETTSPPSFTMYVTPFVPPQVRIKPPGSVVKGVRGHNLTLTCEVTRAYPVVPVDGYSWSYLPSPKSPQRPLEGKASTLTLGPLTLEDRGQCMCQARNDQLYELLNLNLTGQASVTVDIVFPTSDITETEVGAIFHFPLPDWTSMVVVHPGGHDVISVRQDCSYNVSSVFQSRRLQPCCDVIRHRLSFTLTNVTEEDEGEYVCLEEGAQRSPIPECSKKLFVKKVGVEPSQTDHSSPSLIALVTCVSLLALLIGILSGIVLKTKHHRLVRSLRNQLPNFMRAKSHHARGGYQSIRQREHISYGAALKRLYEKDTVYIFPRLVLKKDTEDETIPLLPPPDRKPSAKQEEFDVKNLLRSTLKNSKSTRAEDLPSFILHNTRLSQQEHVVLVLDKKLGVVVMIVNTASSLKDLHSAEEAVRHLVGARKTVRRKLKRLVTSESVQAVLSLPCMTHNEADELRQRLQGLCSYHELELLAGKDRGVFRQWMEDQGTSRDRKLWKSSSQEGVSPDTVYKMVVSRFLTLDGMDPDRDSHDSADPVESLLLTPAQMEVRDSTARLLHIWGPPGSGKTMLLVHRAREWLAEGKTLVLAVGMQFCDIGLAQIEKDVQKGQGKDARSRVRVCRTFQEIRRAGKDLRDKYPNVDVCVIVDITWDSHQFIGLLPDVESRSLTYTWRTGRERSSYAETHDSHNVHKAAWEKIHLPDCIRCTDSTIKLMNLLGHGVYPHIPSCSVPRVQDIPAWKVVDHCLHPDHISTLSSCGPCKKEMSTALPSMEQGLQWNNWIALYTGNLKGLVDYKPVHEALESFGVPVSFDSNTYLRQEDILSKSASRQDASATDDKKDFSRFLERVMDGVDKKGRPTVHLVRVEYFNSMEREGVILVHWDKRDNDPGCQGQEDRYTRLKEHRLQWLEAVSRSTGQVLLLLLTPSPARSLLGLKEVVML